ncbi:hypothetical protein Sango_2881600 [Sesamum angolense]|uniref:Uncharacterized protein n=1 Tax=Sesamum angolense TaxID=2727404 RepID=A0AAE1T647_9LAMI|nr:hypothetical protein Sango_2881600 [Sesamum angolense]
MFLSSHHFAQIPRLPTVQEKPKRRSSVLHRRNTPTQPCHRTIKCRKAFHQIKTPMMDSFAVSQISSCAPNQDSRWGFLWNRDIEIPFEFDSLSKIRERKRSLAGQGAVLLNILSKYAVSSMIEGNEEMSTCELSGRNITFPKYICGELGEISTPGSRMTWLDQIDIAAASRHGIRHVSVTILLDLPTVVIPQHPNILDCDIFFRIKLHMGPYRY